MAVSKEQKREIVAEYKEWLSKSRAVILAEYVGLTMNDMDTLRNQIRQIGGEFHVVKNTLGKLAFEEAGYPLPEGYFKGSTAVGFAFEDAPAMVKTLTEFAKNVEYLKIKGGYLDSRPVTTRQIQDLADLPPLPIMRARLLGTITAPASKLARTLAEPARQVAAVLKAYAEQNAPAPAE